MIIYNYKKEFLGIDEKDLQTLGLINLADLQKIVTDFADLFVKTPGYVHNFKHVHWIDFVMCAESNEESKVIIHINNKNYKATLQIATTYLIDNPSSKAYIVHLTQLSELTSQENRHIPKDIKEREEALPVVQPSQSTTENTPPLDIDLEEESIKECVTPVQSAVKEPTDDLPLDINFDEDVEEISNNGYIYNPVIASDELGLPVDLVEEFVQDFIAQAKDFKDDLYNSFTNGDLQKLRTLSHKLKGVASNLHIEDALETITKVNTSPDLTVIHNNLDTFYKIIAKLADEKITTEKERKENGEIDLDDDFLLDIKTPEEKIEEISSNNSSLTPTYNKEKIANEIGLDMKSFHELFEDYINEAKSLIEKMQKAIESDNIAICKYTALQLKAMSDNMKITSFTQELQSLINSSDKQELTDAIISIKSLLATL